MRVWNLPNRTHQFLQQTCMFQHRQSVKGEDFEGAGPGDPSSNVMEEGHLLSHVQWSPTGKLLAGAVENLINIWAVAGG